MDRKTSTEKLNINTPETEKRKGACNSLLQAFRC